MSVRARLERVERNARARLRPLEMWDASDHPAGLFECLDHPGVALTEAEVDAHAEATGVDLVLFAGHAQPGPT